MVSFTASLIFFKNYNKWNKDYLFVSIKLLCTCNNGITGKFDRKHGIPNVRAGQVVFVVEVVDKNTNQILESVNGRIKRVESFTAWTVNSIVSLKTARKNQAYNKTLKLNIL